jgi:HEAT repeat protein
MALLVVVAAGLSGCGTAAPTLAGGKPVSYWIEALQSPDAATRKHAVAKLGNVGNADPTAFPAVLEALRDRDAAVRREAILAVMKFGRAAQEAIPRLAEMQQKDRDSQVRTYATRALAGIKDGS